MNIIEALRWLNYDGGTIYRGSDPSIRYCTHNITQLCDYDAPFENQDRCVIHVDDMLATDWIHEQITVHTEPMK